MNKAYHFTIILLCSLFAAGCNEDLLDIEQRGVISEESYYKTDEDAMSCVATLHRLWKEELYQGLAIFDNMTPDAWAGGGLRNDMLEYEAQNEFRYTTEDQYIIAYFKKLYSIIYNANTVLERFDDDSPVKMRVKAEARFFRAYANFMLVTLWGTPYYVDHVLAADEYQMPNAESPSIFWESIEADLKDAIGSGLLPSKSNVDDWTTNLRITKECALSYLGKAYLWQKKYSEAAAALQQVIDSGKYKLLDDLTVMFHAEGDHCPEYIAEAEALNDLANWTQQDSKGMLLFTWKTSNAIRLTQNTDNWPFQHSGGYSHFVPTGSFVDLVKSVEGTEGKRFKNYFVSWDYMVENYGAVSTRDLYYCEGWLETKLLSKKGDIFGAMGAWGWIYSHQNFPHMRYSEVLLMASEAYLQSGQKEKALNYFNMIRTRAGAPTLSDLDIDDILVERRIELWGETPAIFQDIQRYRLGERLCADQHARYPVFCLVGDYSGNPTVVWYDCGYDYGFKDKHYLLPYSSSELKSNPNLKQNPGW